MTGRAEVLATEQATSFVVHLDGREQSHVDLVDPTRLVFDYVRRMADVVDAAAPTGVPLRVLHVGGGGLTLARYVEATRPTSAQVVLEPDAQLTALVRTALPLPRRSGIKVRDVAGRPGLATLRDAAWDVVLLDAFDAGHVPADLVTTEALTEVTRVLTPDGLVVLNLVDRAPFAEARRVLAAVRARFAHHAVGAESATWAGRRAGNLVVVAGARIPAGVPRTAGGGYRVVVDAKARDALGGAEPRGDDELVRDVPTVGT